MAATANLPDPPDFVDLSFAKGVAEALAPKPVPPVDNVFGGGYQNNGARSLLNKELRGAGLAPGRNEVGEWIDAANAVLDVDYARALGTGGKAVVNGLCRALAATATLGFWQVEGPLAVDEWDRAMGYDTASWFASAGGEILVGVGTAGASTWLSGGGRAARAAGWGLAGWDAAGNLVGLGRGALDVYDKGGFNWQNSLQIGGSLLGLGGNLAAFSRMAKRAPDVALGLREIEGAPSLRPFGDRLGAAIDEDWVRLGLHSNPRGRFDIAFRETLDNITSRGGRIKFNLDGLDVQRALSGDPAERVGRYTAWELQQIIANRRWFRATDFFLGGRRLSAAELAGLGI